VGTGTFNDKLFGGDWDVGHGLDDHSRLIAHGAYYPKADSYGFHQTLKQAVQRRLLHL
jgi:hypothetical protein